MYILNMGFLSEAAEGSSSPALTSLLPNRPRFKNLKADVMSTLHKLSYRHRGEYPNEFSETLSKLSNNSPVHQAVLLHGFCTYLTDNKTQVDSTSVMSIHW